MRFHFGVSFRWNTIKKFLFPFLIGLLAYFGFNGFNFGFIKALAYENTNSSWNLTIPNYNSQLQQINCGSNGTMYDVVNDFITNYDSNYYDLFVGSPVLNGTSITFYLSQKNSPYDLLLYSGSVSTDQLILQLFYSTSTFRFPYYTITSDTCSNYQTRTDYGYFETLYETNVNNGGLGYQNYEYNQYSAPVYGNSEQFISLNNNDSFDTSLWFYYSSKELEYSYYTNNNYYGKNLCITNNDTCYSMGDTIPSYYDIASNQNNSTFIEYKDSLGTIYTNFSTNNVNNFDLNISFNTHELTALQYNQNLTYTWSCYGRKNNNNNYYSYEKFSYCDFENLGNYVLDSNLLNLRFQNFHIYDSNNNIITDFSNYDKIFFYVDFQYKDSSLNSTLSNLSLSFVESNNIYYSDYFIGPIYDNFSFPLYSKMLLSTNKNDYSYFNIKYSGSTLSNKYFLYKQQYNLLDKSTIGGESFVSTNFQRLYANNNLNLGYMVYSSLNTQNSGLENSSIDIVIFEDIIVSFRDVSSNDFYYFDSDGNIINNNLPVNSNPSSSNNYNLDYYFDYLENFLFEISSKIDSFHNITQDFYDSTPIILQSTIFILFLLLCVYIIYKEVRR